MKIWELDLGDERIFGETFDPIKEKIYLVKLKEIIKVDLRSGEVEWKKAVNLPDPTH